MHNLEAMKKFHKQMKQQPLATILIYCGCWGNQDIGNESHDTDTENQERVEQGYTEPSSWVMVKLSILIIIQQGTLMKDLSKGRLKIKYMMSLSPLIWKQCHKVLLL